MNTIELIHDFFRKPGALVDLQRMVGEFIRHRRSIEADDLIHQVVVEMLEKPDNVRATTSGEIRERIRTGTQRRFIDDIRRRRRRGEVALAGVPEPEERFQNNVAQDERLERLRERVARLPERHKELLRLRYSEDLSVDEIAMRVGQTSAAVERSLGRIRQRLGDELRELPQVKQPSGN